MADSVAFGLPPCRVCEAPSTGIHYGVITCEACKAFYRRSLARGDIYECRESRTCIISCKNRNSCAYCRMQKCINLGMSKDAIRTGRHTYEIKHSNYSKLNSVGCANQSIKDCDKSKTLQTKRNIINTKNNYEITSTKTLEPLTQDHRADCERLLASTAETLDLIVKRLSHRKNDASGLYENNVQISEGHCSKTSESCGDLGVPLNTHFPDEYNINEFSKSDLSVKHFINSVDNTECSSSLGNEIELANRVCIESAVLQDSAGCHSATLLAAQGAMSDAGCHRNLYDGSKVNIYESVIDKLCDKLSIKPWKGIKLVTDTLSDKEKEYLEVIELKKQIFGPLKPMPMEEYLNFYKQTGIDLDGRREFLEKIIPLMDLNIKASIEFAKAIPGFSDLCVDDQIELIKGSRSDLNILKMQCCYKADHKLFIPVPGVVLHRDDFLKLGEGPVDVFAIIQKIQRLELFAEELVVLCALCIMTTDERELKDAGLVESSQDFLLECLFYLFDKYHPHNKMRFPHIINCLMEMRIYHHSVSKDEGEFVNTWSCYVDFPPVYVEIVN